jgi:hypothetical protein
MLIYLSVVFDNSLEYDANLRHCPSYKTGEILPSDVEAVWPHVPLIPIIIPVFRWIVL